MRPPAGFAAQLSEHGLRADEVVVEDTAGDVEQIPDGGVPHAVAHGRALLAGLHDVLGPQHRELLGHGGLVETEGLLQLVHPATCCACFPSAWYFSASVVAE